MDRVSLGEGLRLCQGCLSLRLDTCLLQKDPGDGPYESMFISLRPAECSLCSLIGSWLRRRRAADGILVAEDDAKALKTYAIGTARRELIGARPGEVVEVRRFEVVLASSPQIKVVRLWPCLYPVPSLRYRGDAH